VVFIAKILSLSLFVCVKFHQPPMHSTSDTLIWYKIIYSIYTVCNGCT
jgi:hypothetical protein